jgi:hypothetical protein
MVMLATPPQAGEASGDRKTTRVETTTASLNLDAVTEAAFPYDV